MEKTRGSMILSDDEEYGFDSFGASTEVSNDSCGSLKRVKLDEAPSSHLARPHLVLPEPSTMPLIVSPTDFNKAIDQLIEGASSRTELAKIGEKGRTEAPTLDPSALKPEVEMPTLCRTRKAGSTRSGNRKRGAEL